MKVLTVKLPETLFLEIAREAAKRKVTRSVVIRERLATPKTTKASLWDRMKDLVIDDTSSPGDLSHNKKHMKGYGQSRAR